MKLVVNFFGPPSSGKTVAATSLFAQLKRHHLDVALVSEFATEKVIEENTRALQNQLYIFANQQYKVFCAYQHARVVIVDSPILLAAIYNTDGHGPLYDVILDQHQSYNNLNILMELDDSLPYSMVGRIHSISESRLLGHRIRDMFDKESIPHLPYNNMVESDIVDLILETVRESQDTV